MVGQKVPIPRFLKKLKQILRKKRNSRFIPVKLFKNKE